MDTLDRIKRARVRLGKNYPFFSCLTMYLKISDKESSNVKSMAVDMAGNIYYSDKWIRDLTDEQLQGVLTHEVLHLAFMSMVRVDNREHELWNSATDLAINWVLVQNNLELPKGLVPNSQGDFNSAIEGISINVKDKTAEQIYDELNKIAQNQSKTGQGKGKMSLSDIIDALSKGGFDKHIYEKLGKRVNEMSESEKEEIKKEWARVVQDAYTQSKLKGNVPQGIDLLVGSLHEAKVSWKNKLLKAVQGSIPYDFTYSSPSKKSISTGIYMPSFTKERINVVVAIDTSGSIGQEELTDFLSEIVGIAKAYKNRIEMTLITHDCEIKDEYKIENGSIAKIMALKIRGGGGTSHLPIFEKLSKLKECEMLISFTDGYSDLEEIDFNKYKFRKLFLLSKDGSDEWAKTKRCEAIKL